MDSQDDAKITEGEIVSDAPPITQIGGAEVIVNMEGMIKNYIASIDRQSEELKKLKEMLDDIFKNDTNYQNHSEKAKEANQIKTKTKDEILKRDQPKGL